MKKIVSLILTLVLLVASVPLAFADDGYTTIEGRIEPAIKVKKSYKDNPVIENVSSTTGLPSTGEAFTPIVVVLDNAEEAYPHWGVSKADIIFQIPNHGKGATKLLALFADYYPEQAGGVRSARATMLPIVRAWNASFAYAGSPSVSGKNIDVDYLLKKWGYKKVHKEFNLLGNDYRERVDFVDSPHNLSAHIKEIHEYLVNKKVSFEERPFLFTDDPRNEGDNATVISINHYGESQDNNPNRASASKFTYNEELKAYVRSNVTGDYVDRDTNEIVPFANVIVLRADISYQDNYLYLRNHMVSKGTAEIFQNGHYVQGAWVRTGEKSRIVILDNEGNELKMQRGKTFIVVTNDITKVQYK